MKKVAKIFFIIGIVTAIITVICFIFAKTNKSEYDKEKEEYTNTKEGIIRKAEWIQYEYYYNYKNALAGVLLAGVITRVSVVLGIALIILNKIREKKGKDAFYKVLLGIGIFMIVTGIIASTVIIRKNIKLHDLGMVVGFVRCSVGSAFIWGYVTYKILNGKEKSFLWGFLLGIIGVIIAICIKGKNKKNISNGNKYEDLMKLKTLKEDGIITEEEFNKEKEKVLKD